MSKTKKSIQDKKDKRKRKKLNTALQVFIPKREEPKEPYDENNPEHDQYIGRDERKNKENNFMGRPTVMTEQVLQKLRQAFSIGCTDREACIYAGIKENTFYNYCKKYPDFLEEKEELKDKIVLSARAIIVTHLNANSESMAMTVLRAKRKIEWASLKIEANIEKPLTIDDIEALNRGEKEYIESPENNENGTNK